MANSATVKETIDVSVTRTRASLITIVIDTVDTDLTIYTPGSDNYAIITGVQYAISAAHNLTIKSGTDTLVKFERGDTSGLSVPLADAWLIGAKGEALKIACSQAIANMCVYVEEVPFYHVHKR